MSESTEQVQTHSSRYADASLVRTKFADTIEEITEAIGEVTVVAKREGLVELMTFLRDEPSLRFHYLADIGGVDLGEFASPRFAVAYQLYSIERNHRLRVKVFLEEDDATLPTMWNLWKASNWLEREIFDMFGVNFEGHPDLRRILMPADYEGYPLRKDFPIKGY
ncbi:MAG TPA: NADH-quinone oxidoreductase subunit C [Blastocatellia bacterium]|nr:NADH-quinone oxidoreductase subunit C [Blastocatellia bacterium]HMV83993.1 NADH-quinone oxidoreductase subunit C [Blastocatellia bacterium]HMX24865.1 NADH-quinone oxidoreductase subunit C [Blastocatellia bacterium]HMY73672.1 NADH-quinone oxidoreductase subunit C [Blastocatellia bacterium]HMZ19468.1 NADH-quinone oxidoreductase subunit C [Blastocatellia bacterium]